MKLKTVAISALGAGLLLSLGHTWAEQNKTRDVMRAKLQHAQGVLEGIALQNFGLIATNALHLQRLSQTADWMVRQTAEYQRLSQQFLRQAKSLQEAAEGSNVDAAIVAYFQMTVSCVHCHRYLGGARVAFRPPISVPLPLPPSTPRLAGGRVE